MKVICDKTFLYDSYDYDIAGVAQWLERCAYVRVPHIL